MFGPHLIIEAYGSPKELLSDLNLMSNVLENYPPKLNMTKIMPPYIFPYHGTVEEDWGVSGIVLIAESHISIHTFPEKAFSTLDIFSCKEFDVNLAIDFFTNAYKPQQFDHKLIMRGREFPRDMGKATGIINNDRARLAGLRS